MSENEIKQIVRYSLYLQSDRLNRKAIIKGELTPEEEKKLVENAIRFEIANLFQMMGRYYGDFRFEGDPPQVVLRDDLPMPPMKIEISTETQHWDTRLIMKVIEKKE